MSSNSPAAAAVASNGSAGADQARLSSVEEELVGFFVRLATSIGLPRSIGEIFGFLFGAAGPVPFDEVVDRLGISKGSASQGLRVLQSLNAVSTVYVARDRRTFYVAETSVRKLVANFLAETVRPHLESAAADLSRIAALAEAEGDDTDSDSAVLARVRSLQTWHRKATRMLPWVARLAEIRKS